MTYKYKGRGQVNVSQMEDEQLQALFQDSAQELRNRGWSVSYQLSYQQDNLARTMSAGSHHNTILGLTRDQTSGTVAEDCSVSRSRSFSQSKGYGIAYSVSECKSSDDEAED